MKIHHTLLFLDHIAQKKCSIYQIIATFIAIICVRFSVETWISAFSFHNFGFYLFGFLHTALFFYIIFICCVWLLSSIARFSTKQATMLFMHGFFLVIFPPIIDHILSIGFYDGTKFLSYYLFDSATGLWHSFMTFFGDHPRDGITYGTRIIIAITIILMSAVTYHNTKKISRMFLMAIATYVVFFLFSALPSLLTIIATDAHFATTNYSVAGFIASPTNILNMPITHPFNAIVIKMTLVYIILATLFTCIVFCVINRTVFLSLVRNIRPIQCLYHIGLIIFGICVALAFDAGVFIPHFFSLLAVIVVFLAAIIAWWGTVIFNDIVDIDIDRISNPTRPLVTGTISIRAYSHIGIAFTLISLLLIAYVNYYALTALVFYHALSFLYNTPPLRLKRFPVIATFTASLASFCLVIIGYIIISDTHSLQNFPFLVAILLIVAYTISLPIKDLKDIAGDKKNSVYTIPVILGEKFGRLVIGSGIFLSFVLCIFTFNNTQLLWPAVLAGTLCFWALVGIRNGSFLFNPRASVGIVFIIVSLFSIILATSL